MQQQVLFLHTNYPAQFRFLVKEYIALGWDVRFASHTTKHPPLPEIKFLKLSKVPKKSSKFDFQRNNSLSIFYQLLKEKRESGLSPRRIYVHTGWGMGQFLKDLFPKAVVIAYSEWWFNFNAEDFFFNASNEFVSHSLDTRLNMVLRNQAFALELVNSDVIVAPTDWQKSQLPYQFQKKCTVIFDGIDLDMFKPGSPCISSDQELKAINPQYPLLTYATRGLEPYRGFPEFVKAAEYLLANNPDWQVAIAGRDVVNYHKTSKSPEEGFGARALRQFEDKGFGKRVHYLGHLSFNSYRNLLQSSTLHCYFTRPYVLSWSLLESAMVGCRLICSSTSPVKEFLSQDKYTTLVDYCSDDLGEKLAETARTAQSDPKNIKYLSLKSRKMLVEKVERFTCVAKHLEIANRVDPL